MVSFGWREAARAMAGWRFRRVEPERRGIPGGTPKTTGNMKQIPF